MATAGAHLQAIDSTAQAVVGHAHAVGAEVDAGTSQHHITLDLHGMGAVG